MIAVTPIRTPGPAVRALRAAVALLTACGGDSAPPVPGVTASSPLAVAPVSPIADPPPECVDGAPVDADVVARWDGGELTWGDVHGRIDGDLRSLDVQHAIARYELESQVVDAVVVERLLSDEAARQGEPDVDALLRREVDAHVAEPTPAQIADYYPRVARRLGDASLDEATPYVADELRGRARDERFRQYVDGLKAERGLSIVLPYPELPRVSVRVGDDDPVRGAASAVVTLVEFSEYECVWCERVAPTLDRLLTEYDGRLRIVHKDYPLSGHSRAFAAAIAAHCAGEQGKFWEMHAQLLTHQDQLGDGDLLAFADDLGVEREAFVECVGSGRQESGIAADIDDARAAGVQSTPAFFVNGLYMSGAQPYERFRSVIERELQR